MRYAFLNTFCTHQALSVNPACSAPVKWVRAHGTDVSLAAGLAGRAAVPAARGEAVSADAEHDRLQALADGARAAGRLALDTEFMGEGRYRTLLCLVQLAIPESEEADERILVVDPLPEDFDGSALAAVLADPAVQVVVHAGRQDIALVRRRLDTRGDATCSTRRSRPASPGSARSPRTTRC